nr:MAG TPA: hypothetical protein [Caudoviricetes sp.]
MAAASAFQFQTNPTKTHYSTKNPKLQSPAMNSLWPVYKNFFGR